MEVQISTAPCLSQMEAGRSNSQGELGGGKRCRKVLVYVAWVDDLGENHYHR